MAIAIAPVLLEANIKVTQVLTYCSGHTNLSNPQKPFQMVKGTAHGWDNNKNHQGIFYYQFASRPLKMCILFLSTSNIGDIEKAHTYNIDIKLVSRIFSSIGKKKRQNVRNYFALFISYSAVLPFSLFSTISPCDDCRHLYNFRNTKQKSIWHQLILRSFPSICYNFHFIL